VKPVRLIAGLVISILLLWLLFAKADLQALSQALRQANYAMLIPGLVAYFAGVWVRGLRWRLLLAPVADVSTLRLLRATLIGFTVNNLMVLRLGELVRALLLLRWQNVPPGATLGSIVVERLFDGLTLCAILVVAWFWFPLSTVLSLTALIGGAVFVGGTLAMMLAAFRPALVLRLAGWVLGFLPSTLAGRLLELCSSFVDGLAVLRSGRTLVLVSALSALAWLGEALLYYFVMLGFGFNSGPLSSLLGMAAANFGIMAPSLPGFIGTFHKPLQAVLTEIFGVEHNTATSYTLVVHAALILPVVALGSYLLWREGLSVMEISRRAVRFRRLKQPSTDAAARPL
jgi:uncharacterized protein (TIRG00374 family)